MNTCKTCQFYEQHPEAKPETGTCYGEPPKNILLPLEAPNAGLVAPGARQIAMSLQSSRPAVVATDKACALWRGVQH